jgi:hypothetical protein
LLGTAAVREVLVAAREESPRRAMLRRVVAGVLVGGATTLRLDAAFLVPALLVIPAIVPRPRESSVRASLVVLAGTLPAWGFLSITNHWKFGTWQPFSYGPWQASGSNSGAAQYVSLAIVAVIGFVGAHVALPRAHRLGARHGLVAVGLGIVSLAAPPVRAAAIRLLEGLWMLVVDLRSRDLSWLEAALSRSPRGGMVYIGTLKTALLQSCPYLPIVVLSLLARAGGAEPRRRRLAVALPVMVYLAVFSYFRWHGGLSVNLRYFVLALPFLAILSADGLVRLARRCAPVLRAGRTSDIIVLAASAIYIETIVLLHMPTASWRVREVFYLDVPLVLAGAVAAATTVAARAPRGRLRAWAAAVAFTSSVTGLVWGGLTEITYDAVAVFRVRMQGHVVAARARPLVPRGSLVVVDYADPAATLIEDDVVIAHGARDDFEDSPRLVTAQSCGGRRAFAVMHRGSWEKLSPRLSANAITFDVLRDERHEDLVIASLHPPCVSR